jgi:hypothetical protein
MRYVTNSGGEKVNRTPPESSHILIDLAKSNARLTEQIALPDVELADGTEVRVLNDRGIPYEIRNGYLVKVASADAMVETQDARFRAPKKAGVIWYLVCGLVVFAGIAIVLWMRRS